MSTMSVPSASKTLLGPSDPPAVTIRNGGGQAPVVITCDHANNAVPLSIGDLGLPDETRDRHIAYDIGARKVAEILSDRFDAPAVISGFSRLVIDINRPVDDFTSIREISDGVVVPANRAMNDDDRRRRQDELFWPYHSAVAEAIASRHENGQIPAVISVHSCTDKMKGVTRPWHVGVLMNRDRRMGERLMAELERRNPELCIGDNKPYSGMDPYGYTIETHALPGGLPNVLLEIRQDLIRSVEGQEKWAAIIGDSLENILADAHTYSAFRG